MHQLRSNGYFTTTFIRQQMKRGFFRLFQNHKNFGKCNLVEIGVVSPERPVPDHIAKPKYYFEYLPPGHTLGIPELKTKEQIAHMRDSCKFAAEVLKACGEFVAVGKTTDAIDAFAHEKIVMGNAYPSPLRYAGFPKSVCTSVNNVACHGVPDSRPLVDGDIINVDISIYLNGYHGDCSQTWLVGNVDERGKYLVDATRECLNMCIALCGPVVPFNQIGRYITRFCKERGLESIHAFIGHGIGSYFHGPPEILHYANDSPGVMLPGMTFTIEPILTLGGPEIRVLQDGWTAVTTDCARTAQFEHTLLITDNGAEVLTR